MEELSWLKLLPQASGVTVVVFVIGFILMKYIPMLLKENRELVQGIVNTHATTLKEEREVFREELAEQRTVFRAEIKDTRDAIAGRVDNLIEAHRGLKDEVKEMKNKMEK